MKTIDCISAFAIPWRDDRFRSLTLLDVKAYLARRLVDISSDLIQIHSAAKDTVMDWGPRKLLMAAALQNIVAHCEFMSLNMTRKKAEECLIQLAISESGGEWGSRLDELSSRFHDEIENVSLFFMPADKFAIYNNAMPFGNVVYDNFQSARKDFEEASKCFATERNSACVFHLMRGLEYGLQTLVKQLKAKPRTKNWGDLLTAIETEIAKRNPSNPSKWAKNKEFFSEAAIHLRFLKDAWRNQASHANGVYYDAEDANKIFTHTKAFMQHLATKLKERQ